jgi:hypothetical protein
VIGPGGDLVGVVNLGDMVWYNFRSAYLGYYAFTPFNAKGCMSVAVARVLALAFRRYGMHRLEPTFSLTTAHRLRSSNASDFSSKASHPAT